MTSPSRQPLASIADVFRCWYGSQSAFGNSWQRRCLILGAGISRSFDSEAPLFNQIKDTAIRLYETADGAGNHISANASPGDLFENMAMHWPRRRMVEAILSEPHHPWSLEAPVFRGNSARPPGGYGFFRTLKEYKSLIEQHRWDLPILSTRRGTLLLGFLLSERIIDQILSTNWDVGAELGAFLAGIHVLDEDDEYNQKPLSGHNRIRVFERPDDIHKHPVQQNEPTIYKLHGGVRSLYQLLSADNSVTEADIERQLADGFLVSTSDLQQWRGRAKWVSHTVHSALRSSAGLFVGMSFEDPCMYEATRERIQDWHISSSMQQSESLPPTLAITKYASLRAKNAVTVWSPQSPAHSTPACALVDQDAADALRQLLALHYLTLIRRAFDADNDAIRADISKPDGSRLPDELNTNAIVSLLTTCIEQIQHSSPQQSVIGILLDCLIPASRWAAIAENRQPFCSSAPQRVFSQQPSCDIDPCVSTLAAATGYHHSHASWWYARWSHDCHRPAHCEHCKQIRATGLLLWFLHGRTGFVGSGNNRSESIQIWSQQNQPLCRPFFWPWAWHWKNGLDSARLWHATQCIAADRAPAPHLQGGDVSAVCIVAFPTDDFKRCWQLNNPWSRRTTRRMTFDGARLPVFFLQDLFTEDADELLGA